MTVQSIDELVKEIVIFLISELLHVAPSYEIDNTKLHVCFQFLNNSKLRSDFAVLAKNTLFLFLKIKTNCIRIYLDHK